MSSIESLANVRRESLEKMDVTNFVRDDGNESTSGIVLNVPLTDAILVLKLWTVEKIDYKLSIDIRRYIFGIQVAGVNDDKYRNFTMS